MIRTAPLVLVTRPEPDAAATAAILKARGFAALVDPVLEITYRTEQVKINTAGAQALLVTSASGVRALAAYFAEQPDARAYETPVLSVGAASAVEAEMAGFAHVSHAHGDVAALADLVRARLDPGAGPLIHISGADAAGDLVGDLAADGFETERVVLYEAVRSQTLAPDTIAALRAGDLAAALFYSPRSAAIFRDLAEAAELTAALCTTTAVCLSEAAAAALAPLEFSALEVAARPDQESLMASLDGHFGA